MAHQVGLNPGLPMMVANNGSHFGTAFTVTIEARNGVTTGISAQDRVTTIHTAIAADVLPEDLVRPVMYFRCELPGTACSRVADIQKELLTWREWPG
jgi:3,4-dihydroxy-2-butanone 4-phosphate synthase